MPYARYLPQYKLGRWDGNISFFGIGGTGYVNHLDIIVNTLVDAGVEIAVVIGGGNIFRGLAGASRGMGRAHADYMGMLATVMNGIALRDSLERAGIKTRLMSAISMSGIVEHYDRRLAIQLLSDGYVVIFTAGTGNPFFTTDTAGCLRAIETQANLMLKATRVDGVYDSDPEINATALTLARDYKLPINVFNVNQPDAVKDIISGKKIGTLIN